ncbi:MAG TPA: hypothetical protein VNG33_21915, partial [Polyangiaceae bacterium]|nr:hypothetical protein [Polyangiaceae bacterium]
EVVHFGRGGPESATRLEGEYLQWAPSGKAFAIGETQGLSIYDYSDDGTFERSFHTTSPDAANVHGWWTHRDEFVFASQSTATKKYGIHRAAHDGGVWKDSSLIEGLEMASFRLSPNGDELTYETPATNDTESSLFVMQAKPGSKPKLLGAPGWHVAGESERVSLSYASDGAHFLLFVTDDAHGTRAYLGNGPAYSAVVTQIAPTELLLDNGDFSPDGQKILLWERVGDWGEDLGVMSLDNTNYTYDSLTRMGIRDQGPLWAADGDLALTSARDSADSEVKLELVSLSDRRSDTIDTIPSGSRYGGMWFSAHAEFAAYTKGTYQNYDGAYVDLRYNTVGDPKPVRLPGEGSVRSLSFDPDGTGLYYVREKDNGARDCAYIDLSHQVARDPVKVNRDGRVDYCLAQPLIP